MEFLTTENAVELANVDGIIIGIYEGNELGLAASRLSSSINPVLELNDFKGKLKTKSILYNVEGVNAKRVVLVGLGKKEKADHESVRFAASVGARALRDLGAKSIAIEALNEDAQSSAEGLILGLYVFDELKERKEDHKEITSVTYSGIDTTGWEKGKIIAQSQNISRRLGELPANIATPTYYCDHAVEIFEGVENVQLLVRDEDWAKEKNMGSFLSVAAGSDEPAKFLEIHYSGGEQDAQPLIFCGKGITFDTGGISLKPGAGMGWMRGDNCGAAQVIGSILAISKLKLSINVIGLTPLTENMPSGKATKPSDVVFASNNKSIEIDNTDAEGRLILADALVYAETFNPHTVIDLATLTGAMMIALGDHYVGTFTRSDELWAELQQAGIAAGEPFWRMPLDSKYKKQIKSTLADVKNVGGRSAGAITAAMFLGEFIEMERWAHMDIAGVAWLDGGDEYKPKGMTGIPVRSLVKYAENQSSS